LQASADSAHANDPTLVAAREELARIRLGGGREAPAQPRSTTSAYLSGLDDLLAKYGREAARPTPSVPANGTNNNTDVPAYRNPGFELPAASSDTSQYREALRMTETREAMRSIDTSAAVHRVSTNRTVDVTSSPTIQPYQPHEMRTTQLELRPAVVERRDMPTGQFSSFSRTADGAAARTSYDPRVASLHVISHEP
jgi:hypothetical protein